MTYAPETMSSADGRVGGRADGRTRWIQYTPSNFPRRGYYELTMRNRSIRENITVFIGVN